MSTEDLQIDSELRDLLPPLSKDDGKQMQTINEAKDALDKLIN